ncbi:MAG: metallophosphoesterase [Acidobacteria bacterium]|nr:metallophosphoesterase [Acidobacteriota bacterium]
MPRVKIVHFADLHLDAGFAWAGAEGTAARRRRQSLRDSLKRIARLAADIQADALFCGGDLYEHERATPDTARFLQAAFADLGPCPIYIAPGNHDWYSPDSLYALVDWSPNVHVFREPRLEPVDLGNDLTLWGAAHCAPANTGNFFEGFLVEGPGVHVALCHAAERTELAEQGSEKLPHAAFDAHDIERAGLQHAFLGHYHRPRDAARHTYPGNPDPLAFGEEGERGSVVATIGADGSVTRERRLVAATAAHDLLLDITGCTSQQAVRDRLGRVADGRRGVARLTVEGELHPEVDLREEDLRQVLLQSFDAVQIRFSTLHAGYDTEEIVREETVRGQFVRDVLEAGLPDDEARRVLAAGLRALEGRTDLETL